jgi:hypothetical protein
LTMILQRSTSKRQLAWLISVLTLILTHASLRAAELTEPEVKAAVETWVRHSTPDAQPDAVVELLEPYMVNDCPVAYVAHLSPRGFCLCGASDLVLPVYLYNPVGAYDPAAPDYEHVLRETGVRTLAMEAASAEGSLDQTSDQEILRQRSALWRDLIAHRMPGQGRAGGPRVDPPTLELKSTTKWHQNSPYNDECPELTPDVDDRTKAGCAAIAMAQIMRYWKWPPTGHGARQKQTTRRFSETWKLSPDEVPNRPDFSGSPFATPPWSNRIDWHPGAGGRLLMKGYWDISAYDEAVEVSEDPDYLDAVVAVYELLPLDPVVYEVDFDTATYDWEVLEDTHSDPANSAGDAEVAKICYHAGVAADSRYGVFRTNAASDDAGRGLAWHFQYDPDVRRQGWAGWDSVEDITDEIRWGRPAMVDGDCGGGGHVWIAYGYDATYDPDRMFLMNLGWGPGSERVWFSADCIVPPGDSDAPCNVVAGFVERIAPQDVVKFVGGLFLAGDGSPSSPYFALQQALDQAPDEATLVFKAGTIHTYPADQLVIDRPLTLNGYGVTIQAN